MGKFLQTVAELAWLKTMLIISNLAFWGSGIALMCAGIWMQVELHKYLELNAEYSYIAPYALVGMGAFIFMVGILACCCIVKGHPTLLYLYAGFLAFILTMELIIAVSMYSYKNRMNDGFERGLRSSLKTFGQDDPQRTIDFYWMQKNLECCGNHGPDDWIKLDRPLPVPKSCCRNVVDCDVQDGTQIYRDGCYDKVTELVGDDMSVINMITFLVTLFPLIGIFLTCSLAANITKTKYEQMA